MKTLPLNLLKAYMIKIVKLLTGEELIGDVTKDVNYTIIKKPCLMQLIPSRSNPEQPAMGLFPYASYVDNHTIKVNNSSIVWDEEPVKDLYNQYNSVFGSGLLVTNKPII